MESKAPCEPIHPVMLMQDKDDATPYEVDFVRTYFWMAVRLSFWYIASDHAFVDQDSNVAQDRGEVVGFSDVIKSRVVVFRTVEVLDNKLDGTVFLLDH